jgi:replicative superfamily II helicase
LSSSTFSLISEDEFDEIEPDGRPIEVIKTVAKKGDFVKAKIGIRKLRKNVVEAYVQEGDTENGFVLHFTGSEEKYEDLKNKLKDFLKPER